jgi:hypothetical protein
MSSIPWIELKRTDFLSVLKEINSSLRVWSAPERKLQIGLVNSQIFFQCKGLLLQGQQGVFGQVWLAFA